MKREAMRKKFEVLSRKFEAGRWVKEDDRRKFEAGRWVEEDDRSKIEAS
jgi:hypothetical protein